MANRRGSNQYRTKRKDLSLGQYCGITFFASILILGTLNKFMPTTALATTDKIISPVAEGNTPQNSIQPVAVDKNGLPTSATAGASLAPLSEQDINTQIIKKIWTTDWKTGVAIATCESGLRANAENQNSNGTYDEGLFQINTVHAWQKEDMQNPVANAGVAYAMYVKQGTNPWNSSRPCWGGKI